LIVVSGCEIDLYGFGMSFLSYWNMDVGAGIYVVRALLIACPVGHFVAVLMYMMYFQEEEDRMARENQEQPEQVVNEHITGNIAGKKERTIVAFKAPRLKRNGIQMRFYPFLPIFRFYLVVKEREADDIEALFRVNSLSSFSLGMAQIVSISFTSFVAGTPLDIFLYINIASQCVSSFITLVYFVTPLSSLM